MNLLFKISYGLFVLCAKAGKEESGCIINTFSQQTSMPETFSVTVNKRNFSHDLVEQSGECVVAILSTETAFVESGDALTYDYYQNFIKPEPEIKTKDRTEKWVCKICGYIHEGPLPPDFICPLCKHPASDFEKVQ